MNLKTALYQDLIKMSCSTLYIVYDHADMFAILNDMTEAVILCNALRRSSLNQSIDRLEESDQANGFYVEETKLSANGICIDKKIINGSKIGAIENRQSVITPINIMDCIKIPKLPKISEQSNIYHKVGSNSDDDEKEDEEEYMDNISVLEDKFDEAYGLKKNIDQKMDAPEYLKRCDEQKKRRDVERHKEKMSIFRSGKSTYVKIRTKINKGTMRIIDLPALFADKYIVYYFMETKNLIEITSNVNDEHEYKLFQQLELAIESYWWELNENNLIKKNKDEYDGDPSNNMDPEYSEMFDEFYVFMQENGGVPRLEKDMHQHLNMNSDNHIFERDCSNEAC